MLGSHWVTNNAPQKEMCLSKYNSGAIDQFHRYKPHSNRLDLGNRCLISGPSVWEVMDATLHQA